MEKQGRLSVQIKRSPSYHKDNSWWLQSTMGGCESKNESTVVALSQGLESDGSTGTELDDLAVQREKVKAAPPKNKSGTVDYPGATKGCELLVMDQFTSKYSHERMCKWRHATIRAIFPPNSVRINFTGWKEKHDIQLDLGKEEDRRRVAPLTLLPDSQKKGGGDLSPSQLGIAMTFLKTGQVPSEPKQSSLSELIVPSMLVTEGDTVDVQDIFAPSTNKDTPGRAARMSSRWRKAVVKEVAGSRVRIHYVGYEDDWDEVIDMDVEPNRIRRDNHNASSLSSPSARGHGEQKPGGRRTTRRRSLGNSKTVPEMLSAYEISPDKGGDWQTPVKARDTDVTSPPAADGEAGVSNLAGALAKAADSSGGGESFADTLTPLRGPSPADSPLGGVRYGEENPFALDRTPPNSKGKYRRRSPSVRYSGRRRQSFPAPRHNFHEDTFAERMSEHGLHIVEMEMDGNCLFRAAAHQVYLDAERHAELRNAVCDHMAIHRERFAVFCTTDFDSYLKHMRMDGTWADDLEIRALEECLDRIFIIYSSESKTVEPLATNFEEEKVLGKDTSPIKLSYHGQSHYNSIFDERKPLPHPMRRTKKLLENRIAQMKE